MKTSGWAQWLKSYTEIGSGTLKKKERKKKPAFATFPDKRSFKPPPKGILKEFQSI